MNSLSRRVDALERSGGGTKALLWIDHTDGRVKHDGKLYPNSAALLTAVGLDGATLIGWAGDGQRHDTPVIVRMPDNGRGD